jgi:hypothetical protein
MISGRHWRQVVVEALDGSRLSLRSAGMTPV